MLLPLPHCGGCQPLTPHRSLEAAAACPLDLVSALDADAGPGSRNVFAAVAPPQTTPAEPLRRLLNQPPPPGHPSNSIAHAWVPALLLAVLLVPLPLMPLSSR